MTKNAAELLLELFDKWFDEEGTYKQTQCRKSDSDEWLYESRLAAKYLEEVELWIQREGDSSRATERIKRYIPKYWNWIFAKQYGWGNDASISLNYISQAEIDALDGLASKPINNMGNLPKQSIDEVCKILPQLIDEVNQDKELSTPLRYYVKTVLAHAFQVLSTADKSSTFEQQNALNCLVAALNMAGIQVRDENRKKKWEAAAALIFTVLATSFLTAAGEGVYSVLVGPSEQKLQELTSKILEIEDDVIDEEDTQHHDENPSRDEVTS